MSLPKTSDHCKTNQQSSVDPCAVPTEETCAVPTEEPCAVPIDDSPRTTRCAVLTGAGRSAIAVVDLQGPDAESIMASCFEPATKTRFSPNEIRFGVWRGCQEKVVDQASAGESVVVTPLGHGQQQSNERLRHFEIHCHGGPAATQRIIDDLQNAGAVLVDSITHIGSDSGETLTPLLIREATQVLIQCTTPRTAAIAIDQFRGAMQDWATRMLTQLELDTLSITHISQEANEILRFSKFGIRLAESFRVVLTGPPNVGKSSLMNAIVGYDRSITLDVPGTTRDVLHAETVIDGLPIRLSDTAGIRDSSEPIEKEGIARAHRATEDADLVLQVTEPAIQSDFATPQLNVTQPGETRRIIRVLNKSDLLTDGQQPHAGQIATNSLSGEGIAELMAAIVTSLVEVMPTSSPSTQNPSTQGTPVPITVRQVQQLTKLTVADSKTVAANALRVLLGVNL